jgi:SPP1 gp7 family putative phage head morphogenesis protein
VSWGATAEVGRFAEAIEWFLGRFPVTDEIAAALGEYAGRRAWKIAGVAQLEVVQDVHDSIGKAIETGIPFDVWKKQVATQLTQAWGRPDSYRIETIFRNATQQSYNAGRWRQMQQPEVLELRPYGYFDGVSDSRQSDICKAWDETILPLAEFARLKACPQMHHRCRSNLRSITEREANRRGGVTTVIPSERAQAGFGDAPIMADWQPDPERYEPSAYAEHDRKLEQIAEQAERPEIPTSN